MRQDGSSVEDVLDALEDELPLSETEPTTRPSSSTSSSSSSNVVNEDSNEDVLFGANARPFVVKPLVVESANETLVSPSHNCDRLSGLHIRHLMN
eukprot:1037410-Karenia_brevis.AAC.1